MTPLYDRLDTDVQDTIGRVVVSAVAVTLVVQLLRYLLRSATVSERTGTSGCEACGSTGSGRQVTVDQILADMDSTTGEGDP